ncbi:MAG TPA: TAT-variant-translocated molybdopterin oxidoreductase [Bryobacteraceae bacterium]|jgi:MoCo/4Fe-4S cofactor protein with predicted Tat translocation signal|nr:TAT-variant-translocated molybdopterin oxidoreductase [Bryobacteraceae bacterium]
MNDAKYWRSLEELASTAEFRAFVEDEFPNRTPDWNDPTSRRRFLTLMGASVALAGASGCTVQPKEVIVPYVRQPEEVVPGNALFYATAMSTAGIATGLLVESHLGRPTKIEGNPQHPASLGATDAFMQASILTLYDPDRSETVMQNGAISDWGQFLAALINARDNTRSKQGSGFRVLTGTVTSPTLAAQLKEFLTSYPAAKWHQYQPCGRHSVRSGAVMAFGKPVNTIYRFDRADVVVSLDADFLCSGMPGGIRYARDYSARRRAAAVDASMIPPRLYVAEGTPSITGGMAEHRFRMRTSEVEAFALKLMNEPESPVSKDLNSHRGSSIVIAGEHQPPRVHAIAHALNQALGNAGKTVLYTDPIEANPVDELASLTSLVADMRSGAVAALLILGGNPVYDAPSDLDFLDALKKVAFRAHLGLYVNETAAWCHWHVPETHYLESWSDARAYDGTVSLVQPLISPIYGGKTPHEILNALNDHADRSAHDTVHDYWLGQHKGKDFDAFWQASLHDGVVEGTALPEVNAPVAKVPEPSGSAPGGLEIVHRPDPAVGDGAMSNNAWLQEMPKPQNKMTWDNAVWLSPKSAQHYGVTTGDIVEIELYGRKVDGPVWIMPGHADESLTVHFGYGRTRAGRIADGVGFNAYAIRNSSSPWVGAGGAIRRKSGGYVFATTQHTQTMEERDPFRVATFAKYHEDSQFARPEEDRVPDDHSMFPLWEYKQHKWGMSIDLTACVGCQACMIACQSENNISVVGKHEVAKGRHMNWIRVDRYYHGSLDDPQMYFQPVPCMHCENALCELVCPVAATVHSAEGLNEMVYNRCVGTRYCSNNCPYKVRRFNFFLYADWDTQSLFGSRNPDVTVRSRGVMEKCSYCVQRISRAKIDAERQDRPLADGDIVTACQQACPAQAIVFGDLNDPVSRVSKLKSQQRDYSLLEELDTRPRTTYLARLRNPNPELERG